MSNANFRLRERISFVIHSFIQIPGLPWKTIYMHDERSQLVEYDIIVEIKYKCQTSFKWLWYFYKNKSNNQIYHLGNQSCNFFYVYNMHVLGGESALKTTVLYRCSKVINRLKENISGLLTKTEVNTSTIRRKQRIITTAIFLT